MSAHTHSHAPVPAASTAGPSYHYGGRLTPDGTVVDPIVVEIVQGSLASVEMEVETAIGRTSRSPMIRDAHDFRAGIHDRHLRKLTGRSYSALVHPVARDYPIETMKEGDVFFHNDVYASEGGIGHLPDLCVTVPVFHDGEVVADLYGHGVTIRRRIRRRRGGMAGGLTAGRGAKRKQQAQQGGHRPKRPFFHLLLSLPNSCTSTFAL